MLIMLNSPTLGPFIVQNPARSKHLLLRFSEVEWSFLFAVSVLKHYVLQEVCKCCKVMSKIVKYVGKS